MIHESEVLLKEMKRLQLLKELVKILSVVQNIVVMNFIAYNKISQGIYAGVYEVKVAP